MNFTHEIREAFYVHDGDKYKAIQLKIYYTDGKFRYRAEPLVFTVSDGANTVNSFVTIISTNQKELISYFTVDAFSDFTGLAAVSFGIENDSEILVTDLDIQSIDPLPVFFSSMFHFVADNAWLASL